MALEVRTLQDCKEMDVEITGHCSNHRCAHAVMLDLDKLIEKFGADYSYIGDDRLRQSLRCSRCGHKGGMITISHSARSRVSRI